MADVIFEGEWHSDKIRNRWYSQPFKDFIASKFGKNAYEEGSRLLLQHLVVRREVGVTGRGVLPQVLPGQVILT